MFPSFQDWEFVVRQDWVWPAAGPGYAVLAIWPCGGASCKQEESCLPPALLSNGANTKAAGLAVGHQLPSAGAFLLGLLGFPVYMEGKRFIQPVSFTSTLTPADQSGGISGLVGMEGKHHNREGIVQTGGCGDSHDDVVASLT